MPPEKEKLEIRHTISRGSEAEGRKVCLQRSKNLRKGIFCFEEEILN